VAKGYPGAIYDNPHGTRRAIISMGRKNAKTTLSACLLLAHLCGPPARNRPNSELYSAAQSRDQAAIIFSLACKMVRLNPLLTQTVRIQETAKTLACVELGTRYRALSAEATTAFGLSPSLIIHDELGRVRGPRSQLYEALETAVGAQEAPLTIIISTQAATDGDLLSILIDDALSGHDPTTVVRLYTAPPERCFTPNSGSFRTVCTGHARRAAHREKRRKGRRWIEGARLGGGAARRVTCHHTAQATAGLFRHSHRQPIQMAKTRTRNSASPGPSLTKNRR
jgi:hypothetical protein